MDYGTARVILIVAVSGALLFSAPSVLRSGPLRGRLLSGAVDFIAMFVLIALVASAPVIFRRPGMTNEGADRYERASGGR